MDAIHEFGEPSRPEQRPVGDLLTGYSYLEPTDVGYAKVTPCFENGKGVLGSALEGPSFATSELTVLRPRSAMDQHFLAYVLQSDTFRAPAIASMTGAGGLRRVSEAAMRNHPVPTPPKPVQRAAVDYLDHETSEINAFVGDLEQLRTLLDERWSVRLNASLNAISSERATLKRYGYMQTGVTLGKSYDQASTSTYPYLRVANVQVGRVDLTDLKTIDVPDRVADLALLEPGDVLMTEGGDRDKLGRGAFWDGRVAPIIHQNHVFAFRCGPNLDPKFLVYALEGQEARTYFDLTARQSTNLASTNSSIVMALSLPIPDLREQSEIVNMLDAERDSLRIEQANIDRAITLAKERRAALITAAVTGQIDVTQKRRPVAEQLEEDLAR
jgi:type I restriction enzyme S subunit